MLRLALLTYGVLAACVSLATCIQTVGFLSNTLGARTIDIGPASDPLTALGIDVALLALFAMQHAALGRPTTRRLLSRWLPEPLERATGLLWAALAWQGVMALWHPLPASVWAVGAELDRGLILALFAASVGWLIYAASLIDPLELAGLRSVLDVAGRRRRHDLDFVTPSLYRHVRHPIHLGWLALLWMTPSMSAGHLLLALAGTLYILLAIQLEERDLVAAFGSRYRRYQRSVPMLLPLHRLRRRRRGYASAA